MKNLKKKLAAGLVAVSVATTGLTAYAPTAEAGLLDSVGSAVLGGGKGGDSAADTESLTKSQNALLLNLAVSASLMNSAWQYCEFASGAAKDNKELYATEAVVKAATSAEDKTATATNLKKLGEKAKKDKAAESMKKSLADVLESGDPAKMEQVDKAIKTANEQRMLSDALSAIALVQAAKIVKDTAKGGLSLSNVGNIAKFAKTAQQAQSLLKARNEFSKMMSEATADYKKARGIKDPSKSDIEKQKNQFGDLTGA